MNFIIMIIITIIISVVTDADDVCLWLSQAMCLVETCWGCFTDTWMSAWLCQKLEVKMNSGESPGSCSSTNILLKYVSMWWHFFPHLLFVCFLWFMEMCTLSVSVPGQLMSMRHFSIVACNQHMTYWLNPLRFLWNIGPSQSTYTHTQKLRQ